MHIETAKHIEEHVGDIQLGTSKFSCEKHCYVMRTGSELRLKWALMSLDCKDALYLILRAPMLTAINDATSELYIYTIIKYPKVRKYFIMGAAKVQHLIWYLGLVKANGSTENMGFVRCCIIKKEKKC